MPTSSLLTSILNSLVPPTSGGDDSTFVPTTDEQLQVLDQVISEVESEQLEQPLDVVAHAVPQVTLQATDTLNPQQPTATRKEVDMRSAIDIVAGDAGTGLQVVEQERLPELPPEVESFLQRVEEHQAQLPQEIVIADGTTSVSPTVHHPAQPVLVLPITPEVEVEGKRKNYHWSIRWLVAWSEKIIKMFSGKVIYRQVNA